MRHIHAQAHRGGHDVSIYLHAPDVYPSTIVIWLARATLAARTWATRSTAERSSRHLDVCPERRRLIMVCTCRMTSRPYSEIKALAFGWPVLARFDSLHRHLAFHLPQILNAVARERDLLALGGHLGD